MFSSIIFSLFWFILVSLSFDATLGVILAVLFSGQLELGEVCCLFFVDASFTVGQFSGSNSVFFSAALTSSLALVSALVDSVTIVWNFIFIGIYWIPSCFETALLEFTVQQYI